MTTTRATHGAGNLRRLRSMMRRLATVGVDMDGVGLTLEEQGVAGFHASYQQVLTALAARAHQLSRR